MLLESGIYFLPLHYYNHETGVKKMESIYMIPYSNSTTYPYSVLCPDGLNLSTNEAFLAISNKAVPKYFKSYFEFEVVSYTPITYKRNVPIYVGIHREPSSGILNPDFCIGSIFYTEGKDFDIIEKYNYSATNTHSTPSKIYTRIPGNTDIVGVGFNPFTNTITIYNNGKKFYSFQPIEFNVASDDSPFYFCLWGNIPCKLKAQINFGKFGCQYTPTGYRTIYGIYYRKIHANADIDCSVTVEGIPNTQTVTDINCSLNITNTIKGTGDIKAIANQYASINSDGFTYDIQHIDRTDYNMYGGLITGSLPIPLDKKTYIEFTIKNGELINGIIGIPISIVLTNSNNTILSSSFKIPLYHHKQKKYIYEEINNFTPVDKNIEDVLTTVVPEQGKIVGIGFDIGNNKVSIYVDKVLFYTYTITNMDIHNSNFYVYAGIHDDGVFTGTINGKFNFGASTIDGDIPDGYMSLYDYYHQKEPKPVGCDINCSIIVIDRKVHKEVVIHGRINVLPPMSDAEASFDHAGINKLMGTYNMVSDKEKHMEPSITMQDMDKIIMENNNEYNPDEYH